MSVSSPVTNLQLNTRTASPLDGLTPEQRRELDALNEARRKAEWTDHEAAATKAYVTRRDQIIWENMLKGGK